MVSGACFERACSVLAGVACAGAALQGAATGRCRRSEPLGDLVAGAWAAADAARLGACVCNLQGKMVHGVQAEAKG